MPLSILLIYFIDLLNASIVIRLLQANHQDLTITEIYIIMIISKILGTRSLDIFLVNTVEANFRQDKANGTINKDVRRK